MHRACLSSLRVSQLTFSTRRGEKFPLSLVKTGPANAQYGVAPAMIKLMAKAARNFIFHSLPPLVGPGHRAFSRRGIDHPSTTRGSNVGQKQLRRVTIYVNARGRVWRVSYGFLRELVAREEPPQARAR